LISSFFTSTGVHLRMLREDDATELFSLTEKNRRYLRRWLPWVDQNISIADTRKFLENCRLQYDHNKGFQAAIIFGGTIVGMIGFHNFDWANRSAMIGYWLDEGHQGKGLMTKACAMMVDIAFGHYKLNRIEIRCATGNLKSCAIPDRLGFIKEGILRQGEWLYDCYVDLNLYSMLGEDWKKNKGIGQASYF
jgi:ribosomal-protein-serine acetyltransferase